MNRIGLLLLALMMGFSQNTLTGKVSDRNGNPLANIIVSAATSGNQMAASDTTAADGIYTLTLASGSWMIVARDGKRIISRRWLNVKTAKRTLNIVSRLHPLRKSKDQLDDLLRGVNEGAVHKKESLNSLSGMASEAKVRSRQMTQRKSSGSLSFLIQPQEEPNREAYDRIVENDFFKAIDRPLSTFSIDVDVASYSNMRRFIMDGRIPPKDAIRTEELINYFNYDYAYSDSEHPFKVHMEFSQTPWNKQTKLVHIGLKGKPIKMENAKPNHLVFLLDVSGSMNYGNKLPLLKKGLKLLVNNMRDEDKVAIVVYAGAAGTVLPMTSGDEKGAILKALDRLSAGGSTAGGAGIKLAYQIAEKHYSKRANNRIILATDGDFNVGTSDTGSLVRLIEKKRESGVYLTVLGFGRGNYNDAMMEKLSNAGNGNYAYIDNLMEAKKVLVNEMGSTLVTIAKDVKIQVEFNPYLVKRYRLIGYENRKMAAQDFDNDQKDAGEIGAGHTVTALYEIEMNDGESDQSSLKYQTANINQTAKKSNEVMTVKLRYKQPDANESTLMTYTLKNTPVRFSQASTNFRFSASVAEFAMLMSGSKYAADANFDHVVATAKKAYGDDEYGYRREFVRLVELAKDLKPKRSKPSND